MNVLDYNEIDAISIALLSRGDLAKMVGADGQPLKIGPLAVLERAISALE